MIWNTALFAFLIIFIGCSILSIFKKGPRNESETKREFDRPVENYILANQSLQPSAVVSLLLSTSFGLNYLFFQIWLGYTVGAWGLVTQGAWVIGMILLGKYTISIKNCKSLHELLGNRFKPSARLAASICSIVGILFMMGWEAGIGASSLSSIFATSKETLSNPPTFYGNLLITFIVIGSLFYTVIGGLKGNANADILLNVFKTLTVSLLSIILIGKFWMDNPTILFSSFFPSFQTMREKLGIWGLITSVAFSLVWQFVDNSTWQTIIAGYEKDKKSASQAKLNLLWSGIAAFIAPGIIGTLLGIALVANKSLIQDNIFTEIIGLSPKLSGVTLFCVFAMIIACVMSLIDGLFLTSAFTLVVDFLHPDKHLSEIDSSKSFSDKTLLQIRFVLIIIAIISLWGVRSLYELLDLQLFDCFYVMMITQLALIGPVLLVLTTDRLAKYPMWLAILITVIFGFTLVWIAKEIEFSWLLEGAGSFTIIFSYAISILFTKSSKL